MTLKSRNPAALACADRARDYDLAGELIGSENIAFAHNLQGFSAAGGGAALFYGKARR